MERDAARIVCGNQNELDDRQHVEHQAQSLQMSHNQGTLVDDFLAKFVPGMT